MSKHNTLQEVKSRMAEMTQSKLDQLAEIRNKQAEARAKLDTADKAMKDATERMSLDDYASAKEAKHEAQTALDMYTGRYAQIERQEYISEEESDKIIDSLLAYENHLDEDFKKTAAEQLKVLAALYREYMDAVADTEETIYLWTETIHANYNSRGGTAYRDPVTGSYTYRSEKPLPVHKTQYKGCAEALQMGTYLEQAADMIKD